MRRVLCAALALLLLLTAAAAEPLVRAGGAFCLALDAQGRIWGWGDTSRGQLGTGRGSKVFAPAPAALGLDGTRVKDVACGAATTRLRPNSGWAIRSIVVDFPLPASPIR